MVLVAHTSKKLPKVYFWNLPIME